MIANKERDEKKDDEREREREREREHTRTRSRGREREREREREKEKRRVEVSLLLTFRSRLREGTGKRSGWTPSQELSCGRHHFDLNPSSPNREIEGNRDTKKKKPKPLL